MLAELDPVRAATARITVIALGLVLGLSATAALPLLLPWQGAALLAGTSFALALLPFAGLALVWYRRGARAEARRLWPFALGVGLLCGLALLPLWSVYRGQVRVLNLAEEPFSVWVDGRRVARVEPSSGESARAGVELTLPAGERDLDVRSELDGKSSFGATVLVHGGSPHLFAPFSAGYCFFVERRGYGDARGEPLEGEQLPEDRSFWLLPDGISLFTPSPEPGPLETSGGTLTSLRQRRCPASRAPTQ